MGKIPLSRFVEGKKHAVMQKIFSAADKDYTAFYGSIVEEGENGEKLTLMGMEAPKNSPNSPEELGLTFEADEMDTFHGLEELAGMLPEWKSHVNPSSNATLYTLENNIQVRFDTQSKKPSISMVYTSPQCGRRLNNMEYQLAAMLLLEEMAGLLSRAE